jgi:Lon protease-like protein
MKLPAEVGIMVLPDAVLFPGVLMPLHIFEPRYRAMLSDALQGDRLFAVGLARREGAPCEVAGLGLVRTCLKLSDGTSNLVLQGLTRVRVVEFQWKRADRPYPVARIEVLPGAEAPGSKAACRPVVSLVRKVARARAKLGVELPKAVVEALLALDDAALFADAVSYTLVEDAREKQQLLETLDVNERLGMLRRSLAMRLARLEMWKKLQGNLPNEHVGHN